MKTGPKPRRINAFVEHRHRRHKSLQGRRKLNHVTPNDFGLAEFFRQGACLGQHLLKLTLR
jgi:hypothetical protein